MNTLNPGEQLTIGQQLQSDNGLYALVMQQDGNLVLYEGITGSTGTAVWATNTNNPQSLARPVRAVMQPDGNFVLYSAQNNPVWAVGTAQNVGTTIVSGSRLVLQNNRNLILRSPQNTRVWASNTRLRGTDAETPGEPPQPIPEPIPQPPQPIPGPIPQQPTTPPPVQSTEPLRVQTQLQNIAWGKFMQTTATLYRDGKLVVSPYTKNDNWGAGLRGRVLVVCVDTVGQAICVSQDWGCTTRCSVPDFSCASSGTDLFSEQFPATIGRYTNRLDIYQAETPSFVDLRVQTINMIKALVNIAQEVKDAIKTVFG
jgi:hypothetical protein